MKKKVVAVLMTCAMAVTMMAGCGGGDTAKEQGSAETSTDKDEKVEITFWDNYATPQSTERFKDLIAKFESENPNMMQQSSQVLLRTVALSISIG